MSEASKQGSGGGAATAAGIGFQENVACYLATLILAEADADPPLGLPPHTVLTSVAAETTQPIDDLLVTTSTGGVLYFQCKTAISLSDDPNAPIASVLDQFVRQQLAGARSPSTPPRRLDVSRDRFVLLVSHTTPSTVSNTLAAVLNKCRSISDETRFLSLDTLLNADEVKAFKTIRQHVQRIWLAITGKIITWQIELEILHLTHVQILDLRDDGTDSSRARDLLRHSVIKKSERADEAWNALLAICRKFSPQRTGGDLPYLRAALETQGLELRNVPSAAADISALTHYTETRLKYLSRLAEMRLAKKIVKINREVSGPLADFARAQHTAIVGEPGAGKSGCIFDFVTAKRLAGSDVVLIAADMLTASSPETIATDLGLPKGVGLVDVLGKWAGDGTAYLVVDALDAARSGTSLHVICQVLQDIRERAPRWHIVASIREYDLRASPNVQDIFVGKPHPTFRDSRFPKVRHVRISRLSDAELAQATEEHLTLRAGIQATPALAELVRNPFNLNLLCQLMDGNVTEQDLETIDTQIGLLDLYWKKRVETKDAISRSAILAAIVDQMVSNRSLHIDRKTTFVAASSQLATLDALLSDGVLADIPVRANAAQIIGFSHNILFDYAVCRLWSDRLSNTTVERLSEPDNADLLLAIRPSITMAFEDLWISDKSRNEFWNRAEAFERNGQMRLVGKVIAAEVAAAQFRTVADIQPLLNSLKGKKEIAQALIKFFVQAAVTQHDQGTRLRSLVGEQAGDWMQLAAELSLYLDQVAWQVRALIWPVSRKDTIITPVQGQFANTAALNLLRFALEQKNPRLELVRTAVEVAANTIQAAPEVTATALSAILTKEMLAIGAHEWLHPLAERLDVIALAAPSFAVEFADTAFRASGSRDDSVPAGGRLIPFSFNKHDLIQMAQHGVAEHFEEIWQADPITATRIFLRIIQATVETEHPEVTSPKHLYQIPFRGGSATLRPDASHIWSTGDHNEHQDWFQVVKYFKEGLTDLADEIDGELQQVLDTLREGATHAIVWRVLLEAAALKPETLGRQVYELLTSPELLSQMDTRVAAGHLVSSIYEHLTDGERCGLEAAILRIPDATPDELQEYKIHRRDRIIGCIPAALIQLPEIKKIRDELERSGGPPANLPDFSMSASWEGEDDPTDWWLRNKGVSTDKNANAKLLKLSKSVKEVHKEKSSAKASVDLLAAQLPVLQEVETAIAQSPDADILVINQLDDELVSACERIASADGLRRDLPITQFVRATLRRAANSPRPEPGDDDSEKWDNENSGWSSPSPRIDAANGLLRMCNRADLIDAEILADVMRLADDRVPAVRFQIRTASIYLYRTAPASMWELIESTSKAEPRMAILSFFAGRVLLNLPHSEVSRAEQYMRHVYRRARQRPHAKTVQRDATTFYLRLAVWDGDRRGQRYIRAFCNNPVEYSVEANAIISHCRELLKYANKDSKAEEARVRGWAIQRLTEIVRSVRSGAIRQRADHGNRSFNEWTSAEVDCYRSLLQIAHNVATTLRIGSGAKEDPSKSTSPGKGPESILADKKRFLEEAEDLIAELCNVEFVEAAYDVLQTLEHLIDADPIGIVLRVSTLVQNSKQDGLHYEGLATDLIVQIVERYLSEYGDIFQNNPKTRNALLDILDTFVGAGWPAATRLTYRLGEVFR